MGLIKYLSLEGKDILIFKETLSSPAGEILE
jgi:hypothetical protein